MNNVVCRFCKSKLEDKFEACPYCYTNLKEGNVYKYNLDWRIDYGMSKYFDQELWELFYTLLFNIGKTLAAMSNQVYVEGTSVPMRNAIVRMALLNELHNTAMISEDGEKLREDAFRDFISSLPLSRSKDALSDLAMEREKGVATLGPLALGYIYHTDGSSLADHLGVSLQEINYHVHKKLLGLQELSMLMHVPATELFDERFTTAFINTSIPMCLSVLADNPLAREGVRNWSHDMYTFFNVITDKDVAIKISKALNAGGLTKKNYAAMRNSVKGNLERSIPDLLEAIDSYVLKKTHALLGIKAESYSKESQLFKSFFSRTELIVEE